MNETTFPAAWRTVATPAALKPGQTRLPVADAITGAAAGSVWFDGREWQTGSVVGAETRRDAYAAAGWLETISPRDLLNDDAPRVLVLTDGRTVEVDHVTKIETQRGTAYTLTVRATGWLPLVERRAAPDIDGRRVELPDHGTARVTVPWHFPLAVAPGCHACHVEPGERCLPLCPTVTPTDTARRRSGGWLRRLWAAVPHGTQNALLTAFAAAVALGGTWALSPLWQSH